MKTLFATAALLLAAGAAASAQPLPAPSPSPSPSAVPEIGRVVTSDRFPEPLAKSSRPTFVVDRARIDAYGARTAAQALVDVPGANLFAYGPFGAQVDYGLRGSISAETLVLLDGVPLTNVSNGTADLGTLPTLGIARIEVVESAESALYGASATGGVINLISGAPQRSEGRISVGSHGETDTAVAARIGGFSIAAERHVAGNGYGYGAFAYGPELQIPGGTRTNADAEQSVVRLGYAASLGSGWRLQANATADAFHVGVPGSLVYGANPAARSNTNRSNATFVLERDGQRSHLALSLGGVVQNLAYADPQFGESDTFDRRVSAGLRNAVSWERGDIVYGLDLARETASLTPPPFSAAQAQSAAYVQAGFDLTPAVRVVTALRGEHDAPFGSALVPSVGTIVRFGAARFSANYGSTFRTPTIVDLYYPGYSNPSLQPERVRNVDATFALSGRPGTLALGWFERSGDNLIVIDENFVPQNRRRAIVEGAQLTATARAYHHLVTSLSLTNVFRAQDLDAQLRLPRTPPLRATLALDRPFDGGPLAFGVRVLTSSSYADASLPLGAANFPAAATTVDGYVRVRIAPQAIATLRVLNAANATYAPIVGYPAPGRSLVFELGTR